MGKRKLHPREIVLLKRKEQLTLSRDCIRDKALRAKKNDDPLYEYYVVAVRCIEKELYRVIKELR